MFVKTCAEREANQMKAYHKQQEEIAHIKQFYRFLRYFCQFGASGQESSKDSR